jgi:hypothetical protein
LQRLLDSLAALPDTPGPTLAETLAHPACRGFRDGVQVIVTTDTALTRMEQPNRLVESQRWVVLHTLGFAGPAGTASSPAGLPIRPWLWVPSPEQVPELLRGGWKEARHGS